jgi:hypothetical protein
MIKLLLISLFLALQQRKHIIQLTLGVLLFIVLFPVNSAVLGSIQMFDSVAPVNNIQVSTVFERLDTCISSTVEAREAFLFSNRIPPDSLFVGSCVDIDTLQSLYNTAVRK